MIGLEHVIERWIFGQFIDSTENIGRGPEYRDFPGTIRSADIAYSGLTAREQEKTMGF